MTQLQHITMNHLSFECPCGHSPLIPVQDMIEALRWRNNSRSRQSQRHDVHLCGQKTFEFRIVYRGGSYDALIGAANTEMNGDSLALCCV